ncbi:MAG: SWIM zinc finger family protein, partial [Actinomycetota bacterium]
MQRWAPPGSVALRGPDPTWVSQLGDATLRLRLGAGTFERGTAYARDGAVVALSTGDHGRLLLATVRGSGRHPYQVLVTSSDDGAALFDARCSCPVQVDCKHVAAAILTARGQVGADVDALPLWESWLSEAVSPAGGPADTEPSTAPLGLQLEVVDQPAGRYDPAQRRLRMLPVTPGRNGWIRTGVSWRDLELTHRGVAVHAGQRDALLDLLARFRAGQPLWATPSAPARVHLDELGPGGLRLIQAAVAAGVSLLAPGRRVQLADGPASVVVDVRLTEGDAGTEEGDRGAHLGLLVRVPGEDDRPVAVVDLVGDPPNVLVVDEPDRLLLAGFDPPLDPAVARLVHAPPLRIPPADVPRFVSTYYPALRQRVAVHSGDGSVELPEIRPPRLGLRVAFEPGHQTWLRWDLVYAAGPDLVRVPLDDGPPGAARSDPAVPTVTRDRVAEQALVRDLDVLDAVPELRSGTTLVPEARISGLRTAAFVLRVLPVLVERGVLVEVEGTPAAYSQASGLPQIRLSAQDTEDGEHPDWFDLDVRVSVDGEAVPLVTLLTALARGEEHLLLDSGTWFALDHPELATLQRLV